MKVVERSITVTVMQKNKRKYELLLGKTVLKNLEKKRDLSDISVAGETNLFPEGCCVTHVTGEVGLS